MTARESQVDVEQQRLVMPDRVRCYNTSAAAETAEQWSILTDTRAAMGDPASEQQAVGTLNAYLNRVLPNYIDELNESTNKRLAFFAFLFGGISGLAIKDGLAPEQAHAVAISLFCQGLELTPMDSIRMAGHAIDAAAGDSPWAYAVHEGLDEFFAWQADPESFSVTRLRSVLDRVPGNEA